RARTSRFHLLSTGWAFSSWTRKDRFRSTGAQISLPGFVRLRAQILLAPFRSSRKTSTLLPAIISILQRIAFSPDQASRPPCSCKRERRPTSTFGPIKVFLPRRRLLKFTARRSTSLPTPAEQRFFLLMARQSLSLRDQAASKPRR